jgi:CelD/BcsL family acetyltransferase involved in cellulose biosynthesis
MQKWHARRLPADSPDISDWIDLYQECGRSPLLHPDFLLAVLREYGGTDTRLLACRDRNKLLAVTALRREGPFRIGTFQPSQAPIGFWLQRPDVSTAQLLSTLAATQPPWRLVLSLTQQDPDLLARPQDSGRLVTSDYIDTARITIATSWNDYWQARGSNLRQNIRKAKNRLEKAGKLFELRTLTAEPEMSDAVRTYGEIESRSWKASEGTAVSPDNDQGRFYADLFRRFARRGRARCYQLVIDGRVAASDLCVLGDEEIVILKTTFDEAFKDYSPAFLMREAAFLGLFEGDWCKRIEFYGRVMEWHTRWTNEIRHMYHATCFRYSGIMSARQRIIAQSAT